MKPASREWNALAGAMLLDLVSVALAHGHDENARMEMSNCVMLSIARSRLNLPVQFTFLLLNASGLLFGAIYNKNTPDLYPSNAHHRIGWFVICITCAQTCMALLHAYTRKPEEPHYIDERAAFIPISAHAMEEHRRIHSFGVGQDYRFSNDSGQGTERNTESLRSHSTSSEEEVIANRISNMDLGDDADHDTAAKLGILKSNAMDKFFMQKLPLMLSSKTLHALEMAYEVINRIILILGFVALTTGIVTYGGIFRGGHVFSGLAHFIKGGVFFWYGILTLGRWAGCFAELGWAWNIKPLRNTGSKRKRAAPSAEFVESFFIFFYGTTNVFLEHLGGWGGEWSSGDLEHISITIMFFGGGLCGMLVESRAIRDLLNTPVIQYASRDHANLYARDGGGDASLQLPRSYMFSMNPIPALIVLLLGLMMSSHHQASMVSTMIHKQWGTLLVGSAFSRALTYIIFYLSPPLSVLPSRPPSELITAFCLMAGGLIFMASAHDTVAVMEMTDLDAMFVFAVSMGLVTFLMAWIILVIATKGWAIRREIRLGLA